MLILLNQEHTVLNYSRYEGIETIERNDILVNTDMIKSIVPSETGCTIYYTTCDPILVINTLSEIQEKMNNYNKHYYLNVNSFIR